MKEIKIEDMIKIAKWQEPFGRVILIDKEDKFKVGAKPPLLWVLTGRTINEVFKKEKRRISKKPVSDDGHLRFIPLYLMKKYKILTKRGEIVEAI